MSSIATKSGVSHWWWQRLSAAVLAPLGLWFVISLLTLDVIDHAGVSAWLDAPLNALGVALFVLALSLHSQLGVQVVIEDYVHDARWQRRGVLLMALVHVLIAASGVLAVLRVAAGGGA